LILYYISVSLGSIRVLESLLYARVGIKLMYMKPKLRMILCIMVTIGLFLFITFDSPLVTVYYTLASLGLLVSYVFSDLYSRD
jgi:hypothetical protein